MAMLVIVRMIRAGRRIVAGRLRSLAHEKAFPGNRVIGVREKLASKPLGQPGRSDRGLDGSLEGRERIQHRRHEHVARESSDWIDLKVHGE